MYSCLLLCSHVYACFMHVCSSVLREFIPPPVFAYAPGDSMQQECDAIEATSVPHLLSGIAGTPLTYCPATGLSGLDSSLEVDVGDGDTYIPQTVVSDLPPSSHAAVSTRWLSAPRPPSTSSRSGAVHKPVEPITGDSEEDANKRVLQHRLFNMAALEQETPRSGTEVMRNTEQLAGSNAGDSVGGPCIMNPEMDVENESDDDLVSLDSVTP
jgi:hypothetical protein